VRRKTDPEHSEVQRQRGGVGGGECAAAEEPHRQHWGGRTELPGDEADERGDPDDGGSDHLGAERAGAVAAHERPDDAQ
jgi:hypothetical protein